MRPVQKTFGSTAAVTTSLSTSHSPGAGVAFTQQATSFTGGYAQQVTLTSTTASTNAGNTYVVTGTDADGHAQTESLTGPAGSSTVTTTRYFATVTRIASSGASTSIAAGNSALSCSATFIPDYVNSVASIGYGFTVSSGASLTFEMQHTYDDVFAADTTTSSAKTWFADTTVTGKSAAFNYSMTNAVRGSRIVLTAFTSGTVTGTLVQGLEK